MADNLEENIEDEIEDKLEKLPILKYVIRILKKIELPALEGLTLYYFLRLYAKGVVKGAVTSRASAISFSFFTAIFPFLLLIIILIPYIPVDGFELKFREFLDSLLPPQTSDFFFDNIFQNIYTDGNAGLISTVFFLALFLMANGIRGKSCQPAPQHRLPIAPPGFVVHPNHNHRQEQERATGPRPCRQRCQQRRPAPISGL
jgi:membrane protein